MRQALAPRQIQIACVPPFTLPRNRAILAIVYRGITDGNWRIFHIFGILAIESTTVSSEAEQSAWVETWARRLEALGLSPVALPLIEVARAFGFLGSQALLMAQPLVAGIANDAMLERISALLDNPELLEQLKVCLEGEEG